MKFYSELTEGIFLNRYQQFLAEVAVNKREKRIIYCPNYGGMHGLAVLGSRVWFSSDIKTEHRFPDSWELVEVDGGYLVCVNASRAKEIIAEGLERQQLAEFVGYTEIQPCEDEQLDFVIRTPIKDDPPCYIQVCPVTMGDEIHRGFFPDGHDELAASKLLNLIELRKQGARAAVIFTVLNEGIHKVFPADHIDEAFGVMLRRGMQQGIEIMAYNSAITLESIELQNAIPILVPQRTPKISNPY